MSIKREKIGFIGLGNMGRPMAGHLAKAGYDMMIFDISSELLTQVSKEISSKPANNIEEIGILSDIVIIFSDNL